MIDQVMLEEVDGVWHVVDWDKDIDRPPAHIWQALRLAVFERDNFICTYCGAHGVKLECDHIIPVAKGGTHTMENLTTSCFNCNRSKKDKSLEEWL